MAPVFMVLLTLNAHTGEIVRSHVLKDHAYSTIEECMQAAIEKGPQKAVGNLAKAFSCGGGEAQNASRRSAT